MSVRTAIDVINALRGVVGDYLSIKQAEQDRRDRRQAQLDAFNLRQKKEQNDEDKWRTQMLARPGIVRSPAPGDAQGVASDGDVAGDVMGQLWGPDAGQATRDMAQTASKAISARMAKMIPLPSLPGFSYDPAAAAQHERDSKFAPNQPQHFYIGVGQDGSPMEMQVVNGQPKPVGPAYRAPQSEPFQIVVDKDGRMVQVGTKSGTTRDTGLQAPDKVPAPRPVSATTQRALAANTAAMNKIDAAIKAIEQNPGAIGLMAGSLPTLATDRMGAFNKPADIQTRAMIGDIGSLVIHNRTGAAMSKSEWERLKAFIPKTTDTPAAAIERLKQLRTQIEDETGALTGAPTSDAPDAGGAAPPPMALTPADRLRAKTDPGFAAWLKAKGVTP